MKSALLILSIVIGTTASAQAGSEYDTLKAGFESAAAPLAKDDLLGAFVGACFNPKSALNNPFFLMTSKSTEPSHEGPLFPPEVITHWSSIVLASWNFQNEEMVDRFWRDLDIRITSGTGQSIERAIEKLNFDEMQTLDPHTLQSVSRTSSTNNTLKDTVEATFSQTIRKGSDGFFYVNSIDTKTYKKNPQLNKAEQKYCYFWKMAFLNE